MCQDFLGVQYDAEYFEFLERSFPKKIMALFLHGPIFKFTNVFFFFLCALTQTRNYERNLKENNMFPSKASKSRNFRWNILIYLLLSEHN